MTIRELPIRTRAAADRTTSVPVDNSRAVGAQSAQMVAEEVARCVDEVLMVTRASTDLPRVVPAGLTAAFDRNCVARGGAGWLGAGVRG